ncbi:PAQR family membrane homeostasis protein TrhA [Nioella sp.]|uniref:PAQR family membrane homeostasis protein TrhA n=1 Tax=Nioella sp. TaxID=1912091 RepID=UPI003B528DA2
MAIHPDPDPMPHASRIYTRAELLSDAIVHLAALILAIGAVPVLITLTAMWQTGAPGIVGVSIYGASLIAMLTASLLYNHLPTPDWRDLLRRLDHAAIYLKIAGTYTPFALLSGTGTGILAVIWAVALVATIGNFLVRKWSTVIGVLICLGMGWAVVIGGRDLLALMSTPVVVLMVVGGLLYSAGTAFLLFSRLRFHNTIWHGFVVAASTVFFVAIFIHAAQVA